MSGTTHRRPRAGADSSVDQHQPAAWCTHEKSTQCEFELAIGIQKASMWSPGRVRGALERGRRHIHYAVEDRLDDELTNLHVRSLVWSKECQLASCYQPIGDEDAPFVRIHAGDAHLQVVTLRQSGPSGKIGRA